MNEPKNYKELTDGGKKGGISRMERQRNEWPYLDRYFHY